MGGCTITKNACSKGSLIAAAVASGLYAQLDEALGVEE
jgi:hypothetical protein